MAAQANAKELEATYRRFLKAVHARDLTELQVVFEPLTEPINDPAWWQMLLKHLGPEVIPLLERGRIGLVRAAGQWAGLYAVRDSWYDGQLDVVVIKFRKWGASWKVSGFFDRTQVATAAGGSDRSSLEHALQVDPNLLLPGEPGAPRDERGLPVRGVLRSS